VKHRGPKTGGMSSSSLMSIGEHLTHFKFIFILGMILLLGSSAFGGTREEVRRLRAEVDGLKTTVAQLQAQNKVLTEQLAAREKGDKEALQTLRNSQANLVAEIQELKTLLANLEGRLDTSSAPEITPEETPTQPIPVSTPSSHPPSPEEGVPSPSPNSNEKDSTGKDQGEAAYKNALEAYFAGHYTQSKEAFRSFLTHFPLHPLAPNAQYWLGECFYSQESWSEAAQAFAQVLDRWGDSEKSAAALLKLGYCREKMGHVARAGDTFREVLQRWPGSEEAKRAKHHLRALGLSTL